MPGSHRPGYDRDRKRIERRVLVLLRRHCPDLCRRLFIQAQAEVEGKEQ